MQQKSMVDKIAYKKYKKLIKLGYKGKIPTFGEAFDFFRKRYNLQHSINPLKKWDTGDKCFQGWIFRDFKNFNDREFLYYRDAENWCLKRIIEEAFLMKSQNEVKLIKFENNDILQNY